jgi:hypothetical protein
MADTVTGLLTKKNKTGYGGHERAVREKPIPVTTVKS